MWDKLKRWMAGIFSLLTLGGVGFGGSAFLGDSDSLFDDKPPAVSIAANIAKKAVGAAVPGLAPVVDKSPDEEGETDSDATKVRARAQNQAGSVECIVVKEDEERKGGIGLGTILGVLGFVTGGLL